MYKLWKFLPHFYILQISTKGKQQVGNVAEEKLKDAKVGHLADGPNRKAYFWSSNQPPIEVLVVELGGEPSVAPGGRLQAEDEPFGGVVDGLAPGEREENSRADGQLYGAGDGEDQGERGVGRAEEDNPPEEDDVDGNLRVEEAEEDVAKEAVAALEHQESYHEKIFFGVFLKVSKKFDHYFHPTRQTVVIEELVQKGAEANRKWQSQLRVLGDQLLDASLRFQKMSSKSNSSQKGGHREEVEEANQAEKDVEGPRYLAEAVGDAQHRVGRPVGVGEHHQGDHRPVDGH